jgi:hypothetical protein
MILIMLVFDRAMEALSETGGREYFQSQVPYYNAMFNCNPESRTAHAGVEQYCHCPCARRFAASCANRHQLHCLLPAVSA